MTTIDLSRAQETAIKRGQEAWKRHKQDATWLDWLLVGEALTIGRIEAMANAYTNQPIGAKYNAEFGEWLKRHQFDDIDKSTRSLIMSVMEHRGAIEQWRSTLPTNLRLTLNHPKSVLRRWRAATQVTKDEKKQKKSPMAVMKEANAELQEKVHVLEKQVDDGGNLWKPADTAREISRVLIEALIRLTPTKAKEVMSLTRKGLEARWERDLT
jgi:CheY-like chemotaxis protein